MLKDEMEKRGRFRYTTDYPSDPGNGYRRRIDSFQALPAIRLENALRSMDARIASSKLRKEDETYSRELEIRNGESSCRIRIKSAVRPSTLTGRFGSLIGYDPTNLTYSFEMAIDKFNPNDKLHQKLQEELTSMLEVTPT